jgi:ATP-dependent RNA helicase DDX1
MPELLKSVDELGWSLPTDIQDEAIPLIMGGGDVMAAAETGSGKTAAFSLPIIQCVHERIRSMQEALAMKATTQQSAATVTPIRINHNDKEALLEVHEGLRCKSNSEKAWLGARATHGVRGGKYYFEATMSGSGLGRLGWSTMAAHYEIGRDSQGFGYGGTGMKSFDGNFEKYGGTYGDGDVVGVCIDWGAMKVSYSVNGQDHGEAFRIPDTFKGTVLFPAILLKKAELSINFGEAPFRFPRGNGFIGIANANKAHLVSSTDKVAFAMSGPRKPLAVVLEPARDLAEQVYDNINAMARYVAAPQLNTLLLVGGDNAKDHKRKLEKGVDIVVGTLGKG